MKLKRLFRKVSCILKDDSGQSELISALAAMVAIVALVIVVMAGIKLINSYTTLNYYTEQLIYTMSLEGLTSGDVIDDCVEALKAATGISDVEISASGDYIAGSTNKVQYGDTINLTVTWHTDYKAIGLKIPVTLTCKKTSYSQQYWK